MKQILLTAMAVMCIAGGMYAQGDIGKEVPVVPVDPTQQTFNEVFEKWFEFNNWDKDAAYSTIHEIEQKIREDFPIDPEIASQVKAISDKMYADLQAKASEMGYSNFKDAYGSNDPRVLELKQIETDSYALQNSLTEGYYKELQYRYRVATIEALTRLLENAETIR